MNKIYKVIWSKVKNCYVVVAEIAKSHSKPKSTRQISKKALMICIGLSILGGGI